MRKFLILPFLLCFFFVAKAKHVTGGEVTYTYLGQGATPGTAMYRITLMLFRDENAVGAAPMPASVAVGIFNTATGVSVQSNRSISVSSIENVPLAPLPNCITNPPSLSYTVGYYTFSVTLPVNAAGYTIAYQTCCRIDGISNTPNSTGATYATQIPGSNTVGVNADDNSAAFAKSISVICYNRPFTLDFSAFDTDNDSLVYRFCGAYDGGAATDASYSTPAGPPYSTISYIGGFTGSSPLGAQPFINPQTGIISGIAP